MKQMLNGKFKSLIIIIGLATVLVVTGTTTVSAKRHKIRSKFLATFLEMLDPPLLPWQEPLPFGSTLGKDSYDDVCDEILDMVPGDPEDWEDGLRTDPDDFSFEWWYFDAHFSDGSSVVVVYYTKPLLNPAGPPVPTVGVTIVTASGDVVSAPFVTMDPTEVSFSTGGCNVTIGDNFTVGTLTDPDKNLPAKYVIYANIGDVEVDLTMTGLVPSWRPGHGHLFLGSYDKYFAWLPSIPSGLTTGTMTYKDKETDDVATVHPVYGSGYHDHNWGTVRLFDHVKQWWWARAKVGDYTVVTADQRMKNKYGNNVWAGSVVILDENGAVVDSKEGKVSVTHTESNIGPHPDLNFNGDIAFTVTFRAENEESEEDDGVWDWAEIRYDYYQLLASRDLTPDISAGMTEMEIYIAELLGRDPWYTRFACYAYLTISIDGVETTTNGLATLELMDME